MAMSRLVATTRAIVIGTETALLKRPPRNYNPTIRLNLPLLAHYLLGERELDDGKCLQESGLFDAA